MQLCWLMHAEEQLQLSHIAMTYFSAEIVVNIVSFLQWSCQLKLREASTKWRLRYALELAKETYSDDDRYNIGPYTDDAHQSRFERTLTIAYYLSGEMFSDRLVPMYAGYFYQGKMDARSMEDIVDIK